MAQEDRTALAHRVLVAVEEGLAKAQRDKAWFEATRDKRVAAAFTPALAGESRAWYDRMIAETDIIIDAYLAVLGEPWAVTSDELPDLAAGDHFRYADADRRVDDEDGPPADSNREGLPAFNGAFR